MTEKIYSNDSLRAFKKGAEELNVFLNEAELNAFGLYLGELKAWSKKINLIGRKDDREIVIKDFLDSLTISNYLPLGVSLLDIGSGAGFPGVPVKIARNDLHVILLENRKKRAFFLLHIIRLLRLNDMKVSLTGNDALKHHFDFVVSRAFGSTKKIIETGESYLKRNGTILAMKGKNAEEELRHELPFLEKKGWRIIFLDKIKLPIIKHNRVLIGLRRDQSGKI